MLIKNKEKVIYKNGKKPFAFNIRSKLLLSFVSIVLILALALNISFSYFGFEHEKQTVINKLESVAILKENQIKGWGDNLLTSLPLFLFNTPQQEFYDVLQGVSSKSDYSDTFLDIRTTFQILKNQMELFEEIFIMDINGKVVLSTELENEDKFHGFEEYFIQGTQSPYLHNPAYFPSEEKISIVATSPIIDSNNYFSGVIAGRANMTALNSIMLERSGLGKTGETYLVSTNNVLLCGSRFLQTDSTTTLKYIRTEGVDKVIIGQEEDSGLYDNYFDIAIIGVYKWISELHVVVVAEQSQEEAFESIYNSLFINFIVTIFILLFTIILALFITGTITSPIVKLSETAKEISKGNLDARVIVEKYDEVGLLSTIFNQMVENLQKSHLELKQKVDERTKKLKEKTDSLEKANLDLSAMNQEIMAKNQELIATQEELETQKENLQMMNAEINVTREQLSILNRNLEKKVRERTKEVEKLLKQKDEFITQLSHDLKTPLTPLVTLAPILKKRVTDKESKEMFDVFIDSIHYMKNLILKTLQLARLNSPNIQLDIKDTNLLEAANTIIQNKKIVLDEKHITFKNNISDSIIVQVDQMQLTELFNNLISNAIKYTAAGDVVQINAEQEKDHITVSITDTGMGMTLEQVERIFDEFYKIDESRHDLESTGLGLTICKRIVEKHGGKIWAESKGLGKGTTFYFTLKNSKEKIN